MSASDLAAVGARMVQLATLAAIPLLVFLVLRKFWCWYWKVSKISEQLNETNKLLRYLADFQKYRYDRAKSPQASSSVLP